MPGGCGGGGCTPPIVASYQASVVNGYEEAWVYWNYSGSYSSWTPTFSWSGGAVPSIHKSGDMAWVNLNDLTPGTAYSYVVEVIDACSSAKASGSFSTSNAPTNEFVGWVSQLVSNPYELDQIGSALSGASVWPTAVCPVGYISGSGPYQGISFTDEAYNLPSTSTSSSGYYQLPIPDTYTTTLSYWTGGPHGYEVTDTETITLSSGGSCAAALDGSTQATTSNSQVFLYADQNGYWNATRWVGSILLSSTNDYVQFGLPPNVQSPAAQGVAFVHTSDVQCGVTIENGFTQAVSAYLAGNGYTDTQSSGNVLVANPVSNGVSSVTFDYHITGIVNETGTPTVVNSYAVGAPFNPGTNAVPYVDPDSSPPSGAQVWTYGATGGSDGWYNGGSYTSTAGLDMSVSVSGGWSGLSFGPSIDLVYTTTTGTSSSHEIVCSSLVSPPSGYNYQFYVYLDGSGAGNGQAINVHVWYDDECVAGSTNCP